jgi:hypothetical protein
MKCWMCGRRPPARKSSDRLLLMPALDLGSSEGLGVPKETQKGISKVNGSKGSYIPTQRKTLMQ